jgi:isopentenyl-diphosphate delta-isomerase
VSGETADRKRDHIELCLSGEGAYQRATNGLERWRLVHDALPEVDLDAVDLSTWFLGRRLELPFLISSMTGGTARATPLNHALAEAAQRVGCALAVGSQRAALEDPALAASFQVRELCPDVPLFANLGAIQLNRGYGVEECAKAVEMIQADGIFLHLNSMQEALQEGGDTDFAGLSDRIAEVARALEVPVLLKTVGHGLSWRSAARIAGLPIAALEVSGAGGTSWSRVEALRRGDGEDLALFGEWGESTAESLRTARASLPQLPLIASGGIYDGVDAAKVLALGADLAGCARPLLQAAASGGVVAVEDRLRSMARQLRLACFYAGRPAARALRPEDLLEADG